MIYLAPLASELIALRHPRLGCMRTPSNDRPLPPGIAWAADCGLAVATSSDPSAVERYLSWLGRRRADLDTCLFAVAPDVLGDAQACWLRSAPLLPQIRALGYPAAFVAQDGFDPQMIDPDAFDVLFIGGQPTVTRETPLTERARVRRQEWKRSESGGWAAIRWAHARGLPTHVGRVNGEPYLRQLAAAGVRSADGTQLTYRSLWDRTLGWLDRLAVQPPMLSAHGGPA